MNLRAVKTKAVSLKKHPARLLWLLNILGGKPLYRLGGQAPLLRHRRHNRPTQRVPHHSLLEIIPVAKPPMRSSENNR
jgi:hypothetical protein